MEESLPSDLWETFLIPDIQNEKQNIFDPQNIKASTADINEEKINIFILLYAFVGFVFLISCYNIFIIVKHHKKIQQNTKKKK